MGADCQEFLRPVSRNAFRSAGRNGRVIPGANLRMRRDCLPQVSAASRVQEPYRYTLLFDHGIEADNARTYQDCLFRVLRCDAAQL